MYLQRLASLAIEAAEWKVFEYRRKIRRKVSQAPRWPWTLGIDGDSLTVHFATMAGSWNVMQERAGFDLPSAE